MLSRPPRPNSRWLRILRGCVGLLALQSSLASAKEIQDTWIYLYPSFNAVSFHQTPASGSPYSFSSASAEAAGFRIGRYYEEWQFEIGYSLYKLNISSLIEGVPSANALTLSKFSASAAHRIFYHWSDAKINGYFKLGLQGQSAPLVGPGELQPQIVTAFDKGVELGLFFVSYLDLRTRARFSASWMPSFSVGDHLNSSSELKSIANFEVSLGLQRLLTKNWSLGIYEVMTASRLYGTILQVDGTNPYTDVSSTDLSTQLHVGYQF